MDFHEDQHQHHVLGQEQQQVSGSDDDVASLVGIFSSFQIELLNNPVTADQLDATRVKVYEIMLDLINDRQEAAAEADGSSLDEMDHRCRV